MRRIAQGALEARDEDGVKAHDDAAFDLINKYVLSEARFDEKDADAMYGNSTQAAHLIGEWEKETGNNAKEVEEHSRQKPGAKPTWIKDELGKTAYYEKRAKDFEERNPGKTAPAYYREYGDKYVKRFDKLKPGLSKKGQEWMERTKDLLQVKMESGLRSGKWDESKPEELKEKAYDSHSEAYLEAGLADLPQEDIDKVIQAVDRMDMLDPKALKESPQVGGEFISQREFGKAGRSVLTEASHLVPSKEELGKAAKTVIESMPVLPPVR